MDVAKTGSSAESSIIRRDKADTTFGTPSTQDTMSDSSDISSGFAPTARMVPVTILESQQAARQGLVNQQERKNSSIVGISKDGSNLTVDNRASQAHEVSDDSSSDYEEDDSGDVFMVLDDERRGPGDEVGKCEEAMSTNHEIPEESTAADSGISPAPPSRREFKPHPTTHEEKRQAKEDAVSRLNRIKAKAVKSVTKSLGVDESNLSYAVGLSEETHPSKLVRRAIFDDTVMDNPDHVQLIADALGLPIEMFGISQKQMPGERVRFAREGSLADALGLQSQDDPTSFVNSSPSSKSNGERRPPQPLGGSLAAALGMTVNDNQSTLPVRLLSYNGTKPRTYTPNPISLAAALCNPADPPTAHFDTLKSSANTNNFASDLHLEKPRSGSLAQALGMGVSSSMSATSTITRQSGSPQLGSLASALGMFVDLSDYEPTVPSIRSTPFLNPPLPVGGLAERFAALGISIDTTAPDEAIMQSRTRSPRSGSLAAALGIKVDNSLPSHQQVDSDGHSSASGESDESEENFSDGCAQQQEDSKQPKPGTLAAALGMQVSRGYNPCLASKGPERQTLLGAVFGNVIANMKKSSASNVKLLSSDKGVVPQNGRLADAHGIQVNDDFVMPAIQMSQNNDPPKTKPPAAGSLAAALGMFVEEGTLPCSPALQPTTSRSLAVAHGDNTSEQTDIQIVKRRRDTAMESNAPMPGSLAAALGMSVSDDYQMRAQAKGSQAAALGVSSNIDREAWLKQHTPRVQLSTPPAVGSLAAALGMVISDDGQTSTPQILQVKTAPVEAPSPASRAAARRFTAGDDNQPLVKEKARVQTGRPTLPLAGSLAAALGMVVIDEQAISVTAQASPSRSKLARQEPITGTLAVAPGLVVSEQRSSVSSRSASISADPKTHEAPNSGSFAVSVGTPFSGQQESAAGRPVLVISDPGLVVPVAGSLAAALGMAVSKKEISVSGRSSTVRTESVHEVPTAGSLAAALGMAVSKQETAAREVPTAGSLAAALGMAVSKEEIPISARSSTVRTESVHEVPTAGSLAAALGIPVSTQETAAREVPTAGSLAAALGMAVSKQEISFSGRSSTVRTESVHEVPTAGSLAAALGIPVSKQERAAREVPTAGSLAAALGMAVSKQEMAAREEPTTGSLAAALGLAVSKQEVAAREVPTAGSLAAALGMAVSKPETAAREVPTSGSLAAALGMAVSKPEMAAREVRTAGSLAAALGIPVSKQERAAREVPTAGSLAAALGIPVSKQERAAREVPTAGSLAAALGFPVSKQERAAREVPTTGSLAAALVTPVNDGHYTPSFETSRVHEDETHSTDSSATRPEARRSTDTLGMSVDTSKAALPVGQLQILKRDYLGSTSRQALIPAGGIQGPVDGSYFGTGQGVTGYRAQESVYSPPVSVLPRTSEDEVAALHRSGIPAVDVTPLNLPHDVAPESDAEIRLCVALAASKSETAAAKAYGKALEQQMAQISMAYSAKLRELQRQIESYVSQLEVKSRALEAAEQERRSWVPSTEEDDEMINAQEALLQRLCATAERMTRSTLMIDEAGSMLQAEIKEIQAIKAEYDRGYDEAGSVCSKNGESRSTCGSDFQMKLEREVGRQKSIKARLQAIRASQA
jgi:hypothetical protein